MNDQEQLIRIMAEKELARRKLEHYQTYIFKYYYQLHLRHNWHHGYVGEIMEALYAGEITRAVLEMPPSYGKTELAVRQGTSWALGRNDKKKYAYTTYGGDLSENTSVETRNIMESKAYQNLFDTRLSKTKNKKDDWATTGNGGMYATSTGGVITGRHFDGITMDDPIKAMDANSAAARKEAIDFYEGSIITRLRDKKYGFILLIMQRLHVHDLAGYIMENDTTGEWHRFSLKAMESRTVVYDFKGFHYERHAGEPLFEEYEDADQLERTRREMGDTKFTTQYLHDPEITDAGYVKEEWLGEVGEADIPEQNLYIKIDPAMSTKDNADNRAIVVTGHSIDEDEIEFKVMMDCWYGKWGMDDFVNFIIDAMMRYPSAKVLMESSGGGILIEQQLKKEVLRRNAKLKEHGRDQIKNPIQVYTPSNKVTKTSKIAAMVIEWECSRYKFRRGANGIEQIKKEFLAFDPNREHNKDDCIDAMASGDEHCPPKRKRTEKQSNDRQRIRRRISGNRGWRT